MYQEWLLVIQKAALFKSIEGAELNRMLTCFGSKVVSFEKNENICRAGEKYYGIGVVLCGKVMVTKENAIGNRIIMAKLKAGDLFGETIAFSDKTTWPATVIAVEDCKILYIEPNIIVENCRNTCVGHKQLIINMLKIISKKALNLNRKVEYLVIKGMREKVSMYLLEQYKRTGQLTFMIPLNRNELAEFLNVSRPSMSREIGKMKEEGIIDYYKSTFKILDLQTLKESTQ